MSGQSHPQGLPPATVSALRSLFDGIPDTFAKRHEAIRLIRNAFHVELAAAMQDTLNSHLATLPHDSVASMQDTASYVNDVLRAVGLAIKADGVSHPATLVADVVPDKSVNGRHAVYRLHYTGDDGRAVRTTIGRAALPSLTLIPDRPREAYWQKRRAARGDLGL